MTGLDRYTSPAAMLDQRAPVGAEPNPNGCPPVGRVKSGQCIQRRVIGSR